MENFRKLYEDLKVSCRNLNVLAIKEVDLSYIYVPIEDRLHELNIKYDSVIVSDIELTEGAESYGKTPDVKGWTNFIRRAKGIYAIIYIVDPIFQNKDISDIERYMKLYMCLIHEIGHAKDMVDKVNFYSDGKCKNLVEAEGFAEIFTLQYLHRRKNSEIVSVAKGIYAASILERKNKSELYKDIHAVINKKISDAELEAWWQICLSGASS